MKIIGAGFGRSGTMSIKAALEQLGYGPYYHMKITLKRYHHMKETIFAIQPAFPFWFPRIVRRMHDEIVWTGSLCVISWECLFLRGKHSRI